MSVFILQISGSSPHLSETSNCQFLVSMICSINCTWHYCLHYVCILVHQVCIICLRYHFSFARELTSLTRLTAENKGGGGPTTKKIMPPGKTQDVLCLFCSFLFFFKTRSKSTFLCRIRSKMCPQKRTKKIMIFVFFDLLCSLLFFFVVFAGFC